MVGEILGDHRSATALRGIRDADWRLIWAELMNVPATVVDARAIQSATRSHGRFSQGRGGVTGVARQV